MNKEQLEQKRRQVVVELLEQMKSRKTDTGAFMKEDVYSCIQRLYDSYESNIDQLEEFFLSQQQQIQQTLVKQYEEKLKEYMKPGQAEQQEQALSQQKQALDQQKQILDQQSQEIEQYKQQIKQLTEQVGLLKSGSQNEKNVLAAELERQKAELQQQLTEAFDVERQELKKKT